MNTALLRILLALAMVVPAAAQSRLTLPVYGYLRFAGDQLPSTTRNMKFTIHAEPAGGGAETEVWTHTMPVTITEGRFSAWLGAPPTPAFNPGNVVLTRVSFLYAPDASSTPTIPASNLNQDFANNPSTLSAGHLGLGRQSGGLSGFALNGSLGSTDKVGFALGGSTGPTTAIAIGKAASFGNETIGLFTNSFVASGTDGIAIAGSNVITLDQALAIGSLKSNGSLFEGVGIGGDPTGSRRLTIGRDTSTATPSYGEILLGRVCGSVPEGAYSTSSWQGTNRLFVVGDGTRDLLRIQKNGRVAIRPRVAPVLGISSALLVDDIQTTADVPLLERTTTTNTGQRTAMNLRSRKGSAMGDGFGTGIVVSGLVDSGAATQPECRIDAVRDGGTDTRTALKFTSIRTSATGTTTLDRLGNLTVPDLLALGCDRDSKDLSPAPSSARILEGLARLPIHRWSYKSQDDTTHIGPTAQDFHAAFGLGGDPTRIASVDADGVAFASIQALAGEADIQEAVLRQQEKELADCEQRMLDLAKRLEHLESQRP